MTKKKAQIGYEFLDASGNFIYEARETGKTHTPFASEILLFQSIKCGDLTGVKNALNLYRQSGLIIGHMSDNPSRKIHYWAVSTIAVAIHYAILGGLDESEAYQLSDFYIQKIATVYKGNIIKNLIMDCQSYTKYRPNETTGGIFVSWRRKEELPTGA